MINYWLGIFFADLVKYLIFIVIIYPALVVTNVKFFYLLIIFFSFILASSVFTYSFSYLFSDDKDGQKLYLLFNYLASFLLIIAQFLLTRDDFANSDYSFGLTQIFPCSNLFLGALKFWTLDQNYDKSGSIQALCKDITFLTINLTGNTAINFGIQFVLYTIVLVCCEKRIFSLIWMKMFNNSYLSSKAPTPNNTYISSEKEKLKNNRDLTFKIKDMTKIYKPLCKSMITAVNKVRSSLYLLNLA